MSSNILQGAGPEGQSPNGLVAACLRYPAPAARPAAAATLLLLQQPLGESQPSLPNALPALHQLSGARHQPLIVMGRED